MFAYEFICLRTLYELGDMAETEGGIQAVIGIKSDKLMGIT